LPVCAKNAEKSCSTRAELHSGHFGLRVSCYWIDVTTWNFRWRFRHRYS